MNWMCQQCGCNIQIDDTQVPPYPFNVDCPRCRKSVTVAPPPKPEPVLRAEGAQARPQSGSAPANPASPASTTPAPSNPADMMQSFMQMMATMVAGNNPKTAEAILEKSFAWQRKHLLVCCAESKHRQTVQTILDSTKYDTTVPQSSSEAIDIMKDRKIDIVILDPQFDSARQGGIAILRHISSLMPKYRRRIYVVLVSPQVKTLDTYMAFLNCVNLTVNADDLEGLQAILEKSIKDYNELYRPLYEASSISPF
jgi:hypothetical protein